MVSGKFLFDRLIKSATTTAAEATRGNFVDLLALSFALIRNVCFPFDWVLFERRITYANTPVAFYTGTGLRPVKIASIIALLRLAARRGQKRRVSRGPDVSRNPSKQSSNLFHYVGRTVSNLKSKLVV